MGFHLKPGFQLKVELLQVVVSMGGGDGGFGGWGLWYQVVVSVAMAVAMVVVASAVVVVMVDYYDVYIFSNVLYAKIESFDIE